MERQTEPPHFVRELCLRAGHAVCSSTPRRPSAPVANSGSPCRLAREERASAQVSAEGGTAARAGATYAACFQRCEAIDSAAPESPSPVSAKSAIDRWAAVNACRASSSALARASASASMRSSRRLLEQPPASSNGHPLLERQRACRLTCGGYAACSAAAQAQADVLPVVGRRSRRELPAQPTR